MDLQKLWKGRERKEGSRDTKAYTRTETFNFDLWNTWDTSFCGGVRNFVGVISTYAKDYVWRSYGRLGDCFFDW